MKRMVEQAASRLLKKAPGIAIGRRGHLPHNTESRVCRQSGIGLLACPGLFHQPARPFTILPRTVLAAGIFCLLILAPAGRSQPERDKETGVARDVERATKMAEKREEPASGWAWANFVVLVGGLGYLINKHGGPYFAARSLKIRREILEAEEERKRAEARAAAVERKLANLGAEIEALRASAKREEETEIQRIGRRTAAEVAKIQASADQEIEGATKAARAELKRYAAELALGLAGQQIRARMTPDAQDGLVRNFARRLERPASRAETE
jgi:F-type H+-transporting ATPase subunit b